MKTMETILTELVQSLREHEVDIDPEKTHWILKNRNQRRKVNKILFDFFKKYGMLSGGFILNRCCSCRTCYNPFHFYQTLQQGEVSKENLIEIEELTDMINLEELQEMGFARYFAYFNEDNPLPAQKIDFYIACNRKLRANKQPLLARSELDD